MARQLQGSYARAEARDVREPFSEGARKSFVQRESTTQASRKGFERVGESNVHAKRGIDTSQQISTTSFSRGVCDPDTGVKISPGVRHSKSYPRAATRLFSCFS